jgi:phosphoribosylformylglycinamidine synthase
MGQFVKAVQGLGDACRALDFPVVSGNVSLYNETSGQAILPTPAIGGVGLLPDLSRMATIPFKAEGDAILLVGGEGTHLGQSMYLREVLGREDGAPPPVDLAVERRNGDAVRALITDGALTAVHDISDGGMIAAVAEMALASGRGARLDLPRGTVQAQLFGEDQARYVVTCAPDRAAGVIAALKAEGVPAARIGTVTGHDAIAILGHATVALAKLRAAHESWFPAFIGA